MWAALRRRALLVCPQQQQQAWGLSRWLSCSLSPDSDGKTEVLKLEEVEDVLNKVKADDVRVIPVAHVCSWTDYMVLATGRSTWHVKNIAQALLFQAKEKQRGAHRMMLPSVQGQEAGKWIVIDSGTIMIHAFDEKARAYYDLEGRWAEANPSSESTQDLAKAMNKVRRKNNSKKKPHIRRKQDIASLTCLHDPQHVLVDVATGHFVEKTMVEGKDYCQRKIHLLKSNYDQLVR